MTDTNMKLKDTNRLASALAITALWTTTSLAESPARDDKSNTNNPFSWIKDRFSTNVSHFMIFQEEGVGLKIAANPVSGVMKARLGWEQNIVQLVPKVEPSDQKDQTSTSPQVSKAKKNNASTLAASKTIFRSMSPPTVQEFIATGKAAEHLAKALNGKLPLPDNSQTSSN